MDMKKDTLLQRGVVRVVISGPLRLILGKEIIIDYNDGITIHDIVNQLSKLYNEKTGRGHNKFSDLLNQLIIYINGNRWDKKTYLKIDKDTRIDIIHIINGG
ncbi:MAG TPA: hypothetical protein EYH44_01765 [Thermoprotei archaeon]|nr:hypothetical protein [Thermoprotei archaeon]